jgi:hypothetical protein
MGFYKNAFTGFSVLLGVILLVMTYILMNRNKTQLFPPSVSACPDFYSLNDTGDCIMETSVYSNTTATCRKINSTNLPFIEKKSWATDCGVSWDGITNVSFI